MGGFVSLRSPVSRFTRIEGQLRVEHSDRTDFSFIEDFSLGLPRRRAVLAGNYLSWVHDNSLWLATGPIDGGRTNLTVGMVTDVNNARLDSYILSADVRRYVRTGLRTAVAVRTYAYFAGGARPQRIAIGGSYALRGYPRFAYVAGTRALMGNVEWRFPITDYLSIGFPFGEWRFPGVQGAFFADIGKAWTARSIPRSLLGAYGLGLRMSLGPPLVLRLDLGWRYDTGAANAYQLPTRYRGRRFADFWFGFNY